MSDTSITRKDALKLINSGSVVSIQFVTGDIERRQGGKKIKIKQAVRCNSNHREIIHDTFSMRAINSTAHPYTVHVPLLLYVNDKRVL